MYRDPLLPLLLSALLVTGCGGSDGLERVAVSGSVTSDGQPVPNGVIRFVAVGETEGPTASTMITSGRYDIPRSQGPVAGKYEARIQIYDDPYEAASTETSISPDGKLGPKTPSDDQDDEFESDRLESDSEPVAPRESKQSFKVTIPPLSSFNQDFTL